MTIQFFGWTLRVERIAVERSGAKGRNPVEDKAPGTSDKREAGEAVVARATRSTGIAWSTDGGAVIDSDDDLRTGVYL